MVPQDELLLHAGRGVEGDHACGGKRHVTLVFEDDWRAATAVLGRSVDPAGRRANVLVSGGGASRLVGRRLRVGEALVEIHDITRPCEVMEQAATGLRDALEPDGRGGVWGRVLEGGRVRPGSPLVEVEGATEC